jgi:hypothetical protein
MADDTYNGWGASVSLAYPYYTHGGVMFEQEGDHYATNLMFEASGTTYVWWINF